MLWGHGYSAGALHGEQEQEARFKTLETFRRGDVKVLVATDVASRGLDIEDVGCVINYEIPDEPEAYVHRIGRTGRAQKSGMAVSIVSGKEWGNWQRIVRQTGFAIERSGPEKVRKGGGEGRDRWDRGDRDRRGGRGRPDRGGRDRRERPQENRRGGPQETRRGEPHARPGAPPRDEFASGLKEAPAASVNEPEWSPRRRRGSRGAPEIRGGCGEGQRRPPAAKAPRPEGMVGGGMTGGVPPARTGAAGPQERRLPAGPGTWLDPPRSRLRATRSWPLGRRGATRPPAGPRSRMRRSPRSARDSGSMTSMTTS